MSGRPTRPLSPRNRRGALRSGLLAPLVSTLAAGLVVTVGLLFAVQWAVTSGNYSVVPLEYFLCDTHDDFTVVAHVVADLKRRPPAGLPVYILGGSAANEMVESPESLESALRTTSGHPDVRVYFLAAAGESFGQSLAIIDNLPRGPGLAVISVSPNRFVYRVSPNATQFGGNPLLVRSRILDDFVARWRRAVPLELWPGLATYGARYVDSLYLRLLTGRSWRVSYVRHRYTAAARYSYEQRRADVNRVVNGLLDDVPDRLPPNEQLLTRIVAAARDRGLTVVVLESPLDYATIQGDCDSLLDAYHAFCRQLAAEQGIAYIDFSNDIGLLSSDFGDLSHLVEPGRAKWQPRLATELAPWVRLAAEGDRTGSASTP